MSSMILSEVASPGLDMRVHDVLMRAQFPNWRLGGTGTTIPPYSTDPEANKKVREWLAEHGWETLKARQEDRQYNVIIKKVGIAEYSVLGAQEYETFCNALLAAAEIKR